MTSHGLFKIETTGSGQLDIDGTVTSSDGAIDIDSTGVLPSVFYCLCTCIFTKLIFLRPAIVHVGQ